MGCISTEHVNPVHCRLWFVRMPKPLEENTSVSSEHELESFKTQVAILNESMNVKRVGLLPWHIHVYMT